MRVRGKSRKINNNYQTRKEEKAAIEVNKSKKQLSKSKGAGSRQDKKKGADVGMECCCIFYLQVGEK